MRCLARPKIYSSHELIRIVTAHGWILDRVKGSHRIFTHPSRAGIVNILHPRKDLPFGTGRSFASSAFFLTTAPRKSVTGLTSAPPSGPSGPGA